MYTSIVTQAYIIKQSLYDITSNNRLELPTETIQLAQQSCNNRNVSYLIIIYITITKSHVQISMSLSL